MGSLFRTKRSVQTIFFDIAGVVIDAPMAQYEKLGTEFFGCDRATLHRATALHLGELEKGAIPSEQYWERVSLSISESGGRAVAPWKFKGFWEGLLMDSFRIHSDVIDLVRRLKSRVRVGVISNVIKDHAVILQREKVYDHFNPVVLSCKVGLRKPEPEIFAKAAELAKTKPERCLLADDDRRNVEAAEKAGFRAYHYTNLDDFKRELHTMGFLDHV